MKRIKKTSINVKRLGATPTRYFSPFDHNDPGTPVAVKTTPAPLPPARAMSQMAKKARRRKKVSSLQSSDFDPNGWYTGKPEYPFVIPEQDSDDL